MNLKELQGQLGTLRNTFLEELKSAPKKVLSDGTVAPDLSTDQYKALQDRRIEMDEMGKLVDTLLADEARKQQFEALEAQSLKKEDAANLQGKGGGSHVLSLGDSFVGLDEWKNAPVSRRKTMGDIAIQDFDIKSLIEREIKTNMTTTAGYVPQVLRDGDIVPLYHRPVQALSYFYMYNTTQNAIKYMAQSTRTNNAAETSEASAFSEFALAYTETTDIISKIGGILPVTEEELEDDIAVASLVNVELMNMVLEQLDKQIIVGNGSAPNLRGIYNASGIQTQAMGGDTFIDALGKAMDKVQNTAYSNPGLVIMHGSDYWVLRLKKDSQNRYLLGDPNVQIAPRIFGVPIAVSNALTATNALVLDPTFFQIAMRKGVEVGVADQHSDYYAKNLLVFRAYCRAGIKRRRDSAACKVTGLS